jgi:hypothetical protein
MKFCINRPSKLGFGLSDFILGAYKAHMTVGKPIHSGLEMIIIGTRSTLVDHLAGILLIVPTVQ